MADSNELPLGSPIESETPLDQVPETQKVHILTKAIILEEAKNQGYELTEEMLDNPIQEGMIGLILFPTFEKVILPFPIYSIKIAAGQNIIKINIPKVSDGISNVSILFKENVEKAEFDIVTKQEDGTLKSLYNEPLEKQDLLNSGVDYNNWLAFPRTYNTILDIMELKEETPFTITMHVTPSEEEQEIQVGFERIYYKRANTPTSLLQKSDATPLDIIPEA